MELLRNKGAPPSGGMPLLLPYCLPLPACRGYPCPILGVDRGFFLMPFYDGALKKPFR